MLENLKQHLVDYALETPWLRMLWSQLPGKCAVQGCEDQFLRWMEHEIEILSGPFKGTKAPVCDGCANRLRQASFAAGHAVRHLDEHTVEYIPPTDPAYATIDTDSDPSDPT